MKIDIKKSRSGYATIAMADIAFLLLIFLILTVSIDDNGDINLPLFENSRTLSTSNSITITIDESSNIYFDDKIFNLDSVEDSFDGINRRSSVIKIVADRNVDYSVVDRVISSFHNGGFNKIILATEILNE